MSNSLPRPADDLAESEARARRIVRVRAVLTGLTGVMGATVLVGWVARVDLLKRLLPGVTAMNPLTALAFVALSVGLHATDARRRRPWLAQVAAVLGGAVGVSKLLELATGADLCPDEVLFAADLASGQASASVVAPNTAVCLTLLGLGVVAATLPPLRRLPLVQLVAVPIITLASLALLGYAYDISGFYRLRTYIPMAFNSAIGFLVAANALLLTRPEEGFVGVVTAPTETGGLVRSLLPVCVIAPVVVGGVTALGVRREVFGVGTAIAVLVLLLVNLLCVALLVIAARLAREEARRRAAGEKLAEKSIESEAQARELERANVELRAANAAKSAFLSSMSHEIRTPMNAVIGMTSMLLDSELTVEQTEYVETLRGSGDHLLTVINEILDFSKIEAGRMTVEQSLFELRQCVEDAIDLVAPSAIQKRLELTFFVDPAIEGAYLGDAGRLRQILINLLSNAVKFTASGEVALRVACPREVEGGRELEFTVRDTGIGIPADRVGALFQPFTQVDGSTTRKYGGTGLGLVISKKLAELMGGGVWVESAIGVGSTFHVTVVVEPKHQRAPRRGTARIIGKRLLVVDDNATSRAILTSYAEGWGMTVVAVPSGDEALAAVAEGFDVAIVDHLMPGVDGDELAERIRARDVAMPIVLVSSGLGSRREIGDRAAAFAALTTKPVKPAALEAAVVEAVARGERREPRSSTRRAEHAIDRGFAAEHPLRILLVEDNAVNQRVATLLLGKLGYTVDVAGNGVEALEAVERQTYDLVFMDVQMPEMDGLEATRRLVAAAIDQGDRPRVVGMTANATADDKRACVDAGMDGYLSKPVTPRDMVRELSLTARRPAPVDRVSA